VEMGNTIWWRVRYLTGSTRHTPHVVMLQSSLVQFKGHFAWTLDWTSKDQSSRFSLGNS
jgi:hypothetical protein